jgi:hypothetical protein
MSAFRDRFSSGRLSWRAAVAAEDHFFRDAAVADGAAVITLDLIALGLRTSRLPLDKRRSFRWQ